MRRVSLIYYIVWLPVPMDLMHLTLLSVHIIHPNKSYACLVTCTNGSNASDPLVRTYNTSKQVLWHHSQSYNIKHGQSPPHAMLGEGGVREYLVELQLIQVSI